MPSHGASGYRGYTQQVHVTRSNCSRKPPFLPVKGSSGQE